MKFYKYKRTLKYKIKYMNKDGKYYEWIRENANYDE